jgi:hypothetical protein
MSSAAESKNPEPIATQVQAARRAARELARLSADERNQVLLAAADLLEARKPDILKANQQDCESLEKEAREVHKGTASSALLKRLRTSSAGIKDMADRFATSPAWKIRWAGCLPPRNSMTASHCKESPALLAWSR